MSLFDDAAGFGIGYFFGKYILFPILLLSLIFWVIERIGNLLGNLF